MKYFVDVFDNLFNGFVVAARVSRLKFPRILCQRLPGGEAPAAPSVSMSTRTREAFAAADPRPFETQMPGKCSRTLGGNLGAGAAAERTEHTNASGERRSGGGEAGEG